MKTETLVYLDAIAAAAAVVAEAATARAAEAALKLLIAPPFQREIPAVLPDGTDGVVIMYFWAPYAIQVTAIDFFCVTPNSVGTYTAAAQKVTGAANMLSAATFSLNTLVTLTPTAMTLTATGADLLIATRGLIKVTITANNAGMNGAGLVVSIWAKPQ